MIWLKAISPLKQNQWVAIGSFKNVMACLLITLIINAETGKKLSKRDTEILQFIEDYRELGYLPDALFNFISLLGWSPVGEEEIFTPEELIEIFDYERLGTSPAAFDANKLDW